MVDRREFLRDILWIQHPCLHCAQEPRGLLQIPQLKFSLYGFLSGQAIPNCPTCQEPLQLAGGSDELQDRALLADLDIAWQKICDLLDLGFAELTTPPEK